MSRNAFNQIERDEIRHEEQADIAREERERMADFDSRVVKCKAYIYHCDFGTGSKPEFVAFSSPTMGDQYYTLVGPAEFTYIVPEDWNPTAAKVAALEKEREAVKAAFTAKLAEINKRLSELQAITYEAA